MATTTNYSWTTPDDTALVKDGAAAIRSLGTAIDSTVFTNAGAAINKTIVDAKGDIIAATAADTVSRLAVGANDTVLTADSSTATGLKWAAPASGGMTLISTTTLTGASVTLSSIPTTYKNLYLLIRNFKPAADGASFVYRFNADSNANRHAVTSFNTAPGISTFSATSVSISLTTDNSVATNLITIEIPDYTNTTTWKTATHYAFVVDSTTNTSFVFRNGSGFYNQTNAITSLELLASGGNFTSGDALLYGVQ
jgi:hypothetical protein